MKTTFTLLLSLFTSTIGFSQCPDPQLLSWHFNVPESVTISFDAPEGATGYEITVFYLYHDGAPSTFDPIQFTGAALSGTNSITISPSTNIPIGMLPQNYFYEVSLRVQCSNEEYSAAQQFYMSPLSLRNNPGFVCDHPFTIIEQISDGAAFASVYEIEIPQGEELYQIENMGILVDVGHTFNGDLSMTLSSPQGITIDLISFPSGFGNSTGLSIYFDDDNPIIDSPVGFYAPSDSLSAFTGETTHGTWTLTVMDNLVIDHGFVFGGCLNFNTSPCIASVSGSAYYDLNSNASYDAEEPAFANSIIQNDLNGDLFFTNSEGDYFRCMEDGPASLSIANTPPYYAAIPENFTTELDSAEYLEGADFALTPIGSVIDLGVDMFSQTPDRPGFNNYYYVTCINQGNTCVENAQLEVVVDSRLTINDVSVGVPVVNDNVVTVQLGTVCPFQSTTIAIYLTLSDTVSIGAALLSTATLSPIENDVHPEDNVYNFHSVVVGSYDPNDKAVNMQEIDADFINENEYLTYHIRFQNTGTYYAERVVVSDTIDANLDFSSFQLLGTSHPVELSNEGRIVHFTFENILLPDSNSNEPESHGYIRYRIRPGDGFSEGNFIENTAYIYFDFNEAIITNTVVTSWSNGLGLQSHAITPGLFPNPASKAITMVWSPSADAHSYLIYDLTGRQVIEGSIDGNENSLTIPVEHLNSGVYLIYLEGGSPFKPVKWVKL